jgi:CBS domain-containing protein
MADVNRRRSARLAIAGRTLLLSSLLRRTVIDAAGQALGRLTDVIVRLSGEDYPAVTGLVADIGGRELFIHAGEILAWDTERLELATARLDLRAFERRHGEVLLSRDVLKHRLVDLDEHRLVSANDIQLTHLEDTWVATAVDIRPRGLLHRKGPAVWREWTQFEALIGHQSTHPAPLRLGRLRRLKAADLADLIEAATDREQADLLSRVHDDPDLEADVFEELDQDEAGDLLEARSDGEIANLFSRMRADDAADAILDLPHNRRRPVLALLPDLTRQKVTILLGYAETTAGGLMTMDYLSVPITGTVADAIRAVAAGSSMQPEALVTVYCHDGQQELVGAVGLVALLQQAPTRALQDVVDPNPVHVHTDADLTQITLAMADYNLLTLPVLDNEDHLVGVLTVDDVLDACIPDEWRHMRT